MLKRVSLSMALASVGMASLSALTISNASAEKGAPPVMVAGDISGNGEGVLIATAALQPVVSKQTKAGDAVDLYQLGPEAVEVKGQQFSVRLEPTAVPERYVSRQGLVTVDVQLVNPESGQMSTAMTSALAIEVAGEPQWADPLTPDLEPETASRMAVVAPSTDASVRKVPRLSLSMDQGKLPSQVQQELMRTVATRTTAQVAAAAAGVCGYPVGKPTTSRWATIGTSYPVRNDKGTLRYGSSSKSTFGAAVNAGSGWKASGSRTVGDDWGQDYSKSSNLRSFRVRVKYWRQTCYDASGSTVLSRKWIPQYETGGTATNKLSKRPGWTNCEPVAAGGWWRGKSRHTDYSLSYGVKFKNMIGIDLRTQRAYSSDSRLIYILNKKRRLCGNNAAPSKAGKIKERLA